ncbi:MAG: PilZ domain-containing protein [Acidobacteria bacterium]|nr:PilZ domain-containing protein [Acidobacteriota bacterium]
MSRSNRQADTKAEPESASPESVKPRIFPRVPTHAVGFSQDRRVAPRASLRLPMRLTRVGERNEPVAVTLLTQNISSTGIYFLAPRWIEPGTPIELEVGLVDRPLGQGSVRMRTAAHIIRIDTSELPGWHGLAASFDDVAFDRDEHVPLRFESP